ncbi:MAG: hypothetical protein GH145_00275 [Firmicutes bacterium]|nr:hypothetical protein [Bacillota bacterium]
MNLPNKITILRLISIPFFLYCLKVGQAKVAFLIFLVAILSDALDGYLARTRGQKTKLGSILDPAADKALILSSFIILTFYHRIPFLVNRGCDWQRYNSSCRFRHPSSFLGFRRNHTFCLGKNDHSSAIQRGSDSLNLRGLSALPPDHS